MSDEQLDNSKSAGTVCVSTDTAHGSLAAGHAGAMEFPIGGPDGRGGRTPGPNPYDLLNASLAACTAMTIRRYRTHIEARPLEMIAANLLPERPTKG